MVIIKMGYRAFKMNNRDGAQVVHILSHAKQVRWEGDSWIPTPANDGPACEVYLCDEPDPEVAD